MGDSRKDVVSALLARVSSLVDVKPREDWLGKKRPAASHGGGGESERGSESSGRVHAVARSDGLVNTHFPSGTSSGRRGVVAEADDLAGGHRSHRRRKIRPSSIKAGIYAASKGFSIGWAVRAAVLLYPAVAQQDLRKAWRVLRSREPCLYGLSAAGVLGLPAFAMSILENYAGSNSLLRHYSGFICGLLSGSAVSFLPVTISLPTAIFTATRGIEALSRMAVDRGTIPAVPRADEMLFQASSGVLMYCWIFAPHLLGRGYLRFLDRFSRSNRAKLKRIAQTIRFSEPQNFARALRPESGALAFHTQFWIAGFWKATRIYAPVFFFPAVVFRGSSLIRDPATSITLLCRSVIRSAIFLTTYTSLGFLSADILGCVPFRWLMVCVPKPVRPFIYSLICGAFGCGSAILIEKKSRRIELGLYVLMHCLGAIQKLLVRSKLLGKSVPSKRKQATLISMLSMSLVLHALHSHSELLRPSYRRLLRLVFSESLPQHPAARKECSRKEEA